MLVNGRLPNSVLAPVPGGRMRKDAAADWNAMNFYRRAHGLPTAAVNGPLSGYRDLAGQVYLRNLWCSRGACGNAAVPGTSNHGWGIAGDNGIYSWLRARPALHWSCSDAPWEGWHSLDCRLSKTQMSPIPHPVPSRIRFTKNEKRIIYLITKVRKRKSTAARRAAIRGYKRWIERDRKIIAANAKKSGWDKADRKRRYNALGDVLRNDPIKV